MPEELIYTSVQSGLKSGSSGFCTAATTPDMREALITRLEQLSYYKHQSTTGGKDRVISCYRHLKIRDEHYRVLTRLTDAGADFSGRTNFVAHHLVLTGAEVGQLALGARQAGLPIPSPAEVFLYWPDWRDRWDEESGLLQPRDLDSIIACQRLMLPAETWKGAFGDAAAGWELFDRVRKNDPISSGDMGERTILCLIAESLQMLEEREPAKWWNGSTWNHSFTTQAQAEDALADFGWNFMADGAGVASRKFRTGCHLPLTLIS